VVLCNQSAKTSRNDQTRAFQGCSGLQQHGQRAPI
jgi:hypothetical protein